MCSGKIDARIFSFLSKHRFFTTLRVLLCFSAVRGVLEPQPFCRKGKQREGSGVAGKHRCTVRVPVAPAYHRAARSGATAGLLPVCSSPGQVMCAGVRPPFHSTRTLGARCTPYHLNNQISVNWSNKNMQLNINKIHTPVAKRPQSAVILLTCIQGQAESMIRRRKRKKILG